MSVVEDAVSTGAPGHAVKSVTWTHTAAAAATYAEVIIGYNAATALSVTFGGVAMTQVANALSGGNTRGVAIFGLFFPPTGAQTVAVTSTAFADIAAGATTYLGAGSLGAPVISDTGLAASGSVVSASTAADLVSSACCDRGGVPTAPGAQRWNLLAGTNDYSAAATQPGGPAVTSTYTWPTADNFCVIAVPILATQPGGWIVGPTAWGAP